MTGVALGLAEPPAPQNAPVSTPASGEGARTPSGARVEAATAEAIATGPPPNTQRARDSRVGVFVAWCQTRGRDATEPGTVLDYLAHLTRLGHPADTLTAYLGPLARALALSGHPLSEAARGEAHALIAGHARRTAGNPETETDPLQATEAGETQLRAMLGTLDRTTVRGTRDACALLLAWHIGARASEPGSIQNRDVSEVSAQIPDADGGPTVPVPALNIRLRLSKTNPYGRSVEVVRVIARPDEELCLVAAVRAWRALLATVGEEHTGLLLRGVDPAGRIATRERPGRGRPPADPNRRGGFGDRALRDLTARAAREAGLTGPLTEAQRELMSTTAEAAAVSGLDPHEAARLSAGLRRRRRALRRTLSRYSGHSHRRGQARHLQRLGVPRHLIERQLRYVPGSTALARYLDPMVPDEDNPTRPRTVAGAWWLRPSPATG